MQIEIAQCPQCHGPLLAWPNTTVTCEFCGSTLIVRPTAEGGVAVSLRDIDKYTADIRLHTEILAKRVAIDNLIERRQKRVEERAALARSLQEAERAVQAGLDAQKAVLEQGTRALVWAAGALLLLALLGLDALYVGMGLVILLAGVAWLLWVQAPKCRLAPDCDPVAAERAALSVHDVDSAAMDGRIAQLRGDVDNLADRV